MTPLAGVPPKTRWGAYSAPPDSLAVFKGPTSKGKERRGREAVCNWYYFYSQARGCVCTALQLGGDVEQPWLMNKYDVIHNIRSTQLITTLPEENRATAIGNMQKIGEDRTYSSEDMIVDKHTHRQTDRQTDTLITILRRDN